MGRTTCPISDARRMQRPGAIVGKSCHNIAQVRAAVNEGADYIAVGPMFQTATKDAGPIAGPELLRAAKAETQLPIVPNRRHQRRQHRPTHSPPGLNASPSAQPSAPPPTGAPKPPG